LCANLVQARPISSSLHTRRKRPKTPSIHPQVFYGMDYLVTEKAARLSALKSSLLSHLRSSPESLVVVEEYDKLDCDARGLWRQLLQHPERANITWDR